MKQAKQELKMLIGLLFVLFFVFSCHLENYIKTLETQNNELEPLLTANEISDEDVIDLRSYNIWKSADNAIEIVKIGGNVNHFGYNMSVSPPQPISYTQTVSEVKVWVAEYPFSRLLNITTDEQGFWYVYIIKWHNYPVEISFIYEKEGWITTKSNLIQINNEDKTDMCIQFIDPVFYRQVMKPGMEFQLSHLLGAEIKIDNALAVTVGKSWASMNDLRWPHGDAGAIATVSPINNAIGPIYFDEHSNPDPLLTQTSFDGGVAWVNMPRGNYYFSAIKESCTFQTINFDINEKDKESGVELYIASPPDAIMSSNDSGSGLF